jgi:hypothetical protein
MDAVFNADSAGFLLYQGLQGSFAPGAGNRIDDVNNVPHATKRLKEDKEEERDRLSYP